MIETMNPDVLLPYPCPNDGDSVNGSMVAAERLDHQLPRFLQHSITPHKGGLSKKSELVAGGEQQHVVDDLLDSSFAEYSCCSSLDDTSCRRHESPLLPSSSCHSDNGHAEEEAVAVATLSKNVSCNSSALDATAAATVLQTMVRGTLARWNLPVRKLQHKLDSIQALQAKQLKKIAQRKVQTMRTLKAEHEYQEEHRIVRRRLRRVKTLRNHYAKEKMAALEEHQQWTHHCHQMARQNDECARILSNFIDSMEIGQRNLAILKTQNKQLVETCFTYQTIVEVFLQQQVLDPRVDNDNANTNIDE